ncbi:MAG: glycosyltransferase [Verrucomicrobiae bacterium]|nr:glycosyltransferase [Verrucomicrobiae bacterium]MDW8308673.1 glycosyltransferase family 2 protein [Verrucomicrobiales bacterium]
MAPAHASVSDGSPPAVSVIIPAYNYAHYLPHAVASVLAQKDVPFELIVVDDGSTDNTPEVARALGECIRYIRQPNAGLAAARNTGIRNARHDYLAFLDADDLWRPEFLSRVMATFANLPPQFAVVATRETYVDADARPLPRKCLDDRGDCEITARDLLLKSQFPADAVVVHRSAFEQCGLFDETLRSSEDRDMWVRIAARRRIYRIADRLALIRRHGGNMSRQADRMKATGRRVLQKAWAARVIPRRRLTVWLQALSFHFFQAAWMYHEEGRPGPAVRDLFKSALVWPWFLNPHPLNEPHLFRLRSLRHFLGARRPKPA